MYLKYSQQFFACAFAVVLLIRLLLEIAIHTKSYNTFLGIPTELISCSGSGAIFAVSDSDNYFLLTNNHVTVQQSGYSHVSYSVVDYKGATYSGTLKYKTPDHDLAVLYFKKGSYNLGIIQRSASNPVVGETVASVGQLEGQTSAISFGKVLSFVDASTLKDTETYQSNI